MFFSVFPCFPHGFQLRLPQKPRRAELQDEVVKVLLRGSADVNKAGFGASWKNRPFEWPFKWENYRSFMGIYGDSNGTLRGTIWNLMRHGKFTGISFRNHQHLTQPRWRFEISEGWPSNQTFVPELLVTLQEPIVDRVLKNQVFLFPYEIPLATAAIPKIIGTCHNFPLIQSMNDPWMIHEHAHEYPSKKSPDKEISLTTITNPLHQLIHLETTKRIPSHISHHHKKSTIWAPFESPLNIIKHH